MIAVLGGPPEVHCQVLRAGMAPAYPGPPDDFSGPCGSGPSSVNETCTWQAPSEQLGLKRHFQWLPLSPTESRCQRPTWLMIFQRNSYQPVSRASARLGLVTRTLTR